MELSEIREKIDAVDDQLLDLFLQRMDLSEEVAAYKNEHHLPILNKERERAILAKVTERSGEKERYAYHLFSTLFELARSRQAELIDAPTRVGAQIKAALADMNEVFPQTGLVACQGVEGANSQVACDRLLPRGNIVYVKTFQAVVSAVESGLCKFGVLPIENSSNGSVRAVYELLQDHNLTIVRSTRLCIRHELLALPGVKDGGHHGDLLPRAGHRPVQQVLKQPQRRAGDPLRQHRRCRQDGGGAGRPPCGRHLLPPLRRPVRPGDRQRRDPGQRQQLHPLHLRHQGPGDLRRSQPHQPHHRLRQQARRPV